MKKIAVIYENRSNFPAIRHHKVTLENLFSGYAQVKNYFICELSANQLVEGDVYLLYDAHLLASLRPHIRDFKKILIMDLSIQKQEVDSIMKIPDGSEVLVVNDSFDSAVHAGRALYEVGAGHLNLIPYDPELEKSGIYREFKYALTPGEVEMVPSYIPNVIDFHYRVIGFSTLVQISEVLQLKNDIVVRNLILHLKSLAEHENETTSSFLTSHLKTQVINLVMRDLPFPIIVLDNDYHLIYGNEHSERLFADEEKANGDKKTGFACNYSGDFLKEVKNNVTVTIKGNNYIVKKFPLKLMDQIMGFCFMFHSENQLREMEMNLSSQSAACGLTAKYHFQDIVHASPVMEEVISIAKKAADTDYTVLIQGESGTGKELMAQSIHNYSARSSFPFVAINCSTLPESLLESQLFGYEGGSFTGAQKTGKAGLFEQANHGTIFLDEIGDISQNLQIQLLRVLQERQVMRIGSSKVIDLDVHIIAASNKNLETLVQSGQFRSDLFYRLSVIPIELPPLRMRQKDILLLMSSFLGRQFAEITEEQKSVLQNYTWPGNVRQLENAAKYYKTFRKFPTFLHMQPNGLAENPMQNPLPAEPEEIVCKTPDFYDLVLSLIAKHTEPYHGIGRNGLLSELKEFGIKVSDGKLRQLLLQYCETGLITIARGRGGCRITPAGEEYLRMKKFLL